MSRNSKLQRITAIASFACALLIHQTSTAEIFPISTPIPSPLPLPASPRQPVPLPKMPDLVAPEFSLGAPVSKPDGSVEVPFNARIANVGNATAGASIVAAEYMNTSIASSWFFFPFNTTTTRSTRPADYGVAQVSELAAGASVPLSGFFRFKRSDRGRIFSLRLHVDDRNSTEFLPWYVRVNEKFENNNHSTIQTIRLPR